MTAPDRQKLLLPTALLSDYCISGTIFVHFAGWFAHLLSKLARDQW
jgi:hypothetical protein